MLTKQQLIRCGRRKAALLQQSEVHRRALAEEADHLRPVAAWMDLGIDAARTARTGWAAFGPLLGVYQLWSGKPAGLVARFTKAASLAGSLASLWRSWRGTRRSEPGS